MTEYIAVLVNERPLSVTPVSTVLDSVESYSPQLARAVVSGKGCVIDGVGRTVDLEAPVASGAILRTVGRRDTG